jgi:hypothetical protein
VNPATDARNLLDYLHLRHSCDIGERAGRGALREKFGWSRERYSHALTYGLDPANGPLFTVSDAALSPLLPLAPPSEQMRPILDQIAVWSLEMAKTSRRKHKVRSLQRVADLVAGSLQ